VGLWGEPYMMHLANRPRGDWSGRGWFEANGKKVEPRVRFVRWASDERSSTERLKDLVPRGLIGFRGRTCLASRLKATRGIDTGTRCGGCGAMGVTLGLPWDRDWKGGCRCLLGLPRIGRRTATSGEMWRGRYRATPMEREALKEQLQTGLRGWDGCSQCDVGQRVGILGCRAWERAR